MDETRDLLDLMICRVPGLTGKERIELQKEFDKETDFSVLSMRDIAAFLGKPLKKKLDMAELRAAAERDAELSRKLGVRWVSWHEEAYPPLLREIYDPPAVIFYRGVLPDAGKPLAAVVGTRKPTPAAAARAFALGRELGEAGVSVVSGLALGIDAMAHKGNIEGKAATAAVLGSSPDMVYPASNRELARRILENGGAVLSEYPPGTGPRKQNFPARNRIVSGLARGTVIVEAPEKSGALITGRFALEQGRDLFVERAGVVSPIGAGTLRLAEEGAKVISSAVEILAEWNIKQPAVKKAAAGQNRGNDIASSLADYLEINL